MVQAPVGLGAVQTQNKESASPPKGLLISVVLYFTNGEMEAQDGKSAFPCIAQTAGCDGSEVWRTEGLILRSLETSTEWFPVNLCRGNDPPSQNPFAQTSGI